jgi:hypothetical protein
VLEALSNAAAADVSLGEDILTSLTDATNGLKEGRLGNPDMAVAGQNALGGEGMKRVVITERTAQSAPSDEQPDRLWVEGISPAIDGTDLGIASSS